MKSTLKAFLIAAVAAPCLAAAQGIVIFGTSLSDSGNAFAVLGEATTPPDWSVDKFLVPDRPYARGGHHFSNGATWIEQLARPLGLAASVKPAFAQPGGTNFAFGGARAREFGASPTLGQQVAIFLHATGGIAPGKALYIIEMGGNDMRDALEAAFDGGDPFSVLDAAVDAIELNVVKILYGAGARRFLIWNMPNIGVTPALSPDPKAAFAADQLAQYFNGALEARVFAKLRGDAEVELAVLDVYKKLSAVVELPSSFGLENAKEPCLSLSAPYACPHPNDYLFWDGIHPTAAGHAILAHEAARVLGR